MIWSLEPLPNVDLDHVGYWFERFNGFTTKSLKFSSEGVKHAKIARAHCLLRCFVRWLVGFLRSCCARRHSPPIRGHSECKAAVPNCAVTSYRCPRMRTNHWHTYMKLGVYIPVNVCVGLCLSHSQHWTRKLTLASLLLVSLSVVPGRFALEILITHTAY